MCYYSELPVSIPPGPGRISSVPPLHLYILLCILPCWLILPGTAAASTHSNPASYDYTAQPVAQHQPGFFSCALFDGKILLGTYATNNGGRGAMACQLCSFDGHKLKVIHRFKGESIYNIRVYDNYAMLPVEQDALYRYDKDKGVSLVHPRHLRMGHYDFARSGKLWFTSEKRTIHTDNTSQLWTQNGMLCQSSEYTWKEFVPLGDKIYLAAYFIHQRTEAGLVSVNQHTGKLKLLAAYPGGNYCIIGQYRGKVAYAVQFGKHSKIFYDGKKQDISGIGWRFKTIGDTFFLTVAANGWRKQGPSYLLVYDTAKKCFVQKLSLPDAEPWDICPGLTPDTYYLVTRNQAGNLGRIYRVKKLPQCPQCPS